MFNCIFVYERYDLEYHYLDSLRYELFVNTYNDPDAYFLTIL